MKQFITYILILTVCIVSCRKEDKVDYSDIKIYGHGGSGFTSYTNLLPANSFRSIQKAIEILNADGVEVDLQIDNEGKVWLFHDQFLEGKTDCNGCFGEQSTISINSCSYKSGEGIYSLHELINYFSSMSPKPRISLQVQIFERCINVETLTSSIYNIIEANNAYDWIQIESDSEEILIALKNLSNNFSLFKNAHSIDNGITTCINNGFQGLIIDTDNVTSVDLKRAKSLGLKVGLFGVKNQSDIKDALEKHPNQIQTDNIELTNRIMNK